MRTILKRPHIYGKRLLMLILIGILVITPLGDMAAADDPVYGWLAPGDLSMTYDEVSYTQSPLNNMDCDYMGHKMLILEGRYVRYPGSLPYYQNEQWHTSDCAVRTPRGLHDGEYLETIPGELAGKFAGHAGKVLLIPNSNTLISVRRHIDYIAMAMDWHGHLVPEFNEYTGAITYRLVNREPLVDENGRDIYLRPDSYGFSRNGKWMISDSTKGFIRINLETRENTPFCPRSSIWHRYECEYHGGNI